MPFDDKSKLTIRLSNEDRWKLEAERKRRIAADREHADKMSGLVAETSRLTAAAEASAEELGQIRIELEKSRLRQEAQIQARHLLAEGELLIEREICPRLDAKDYGNVAMQLDDLDLIVRRLMDTELEVLSDMRARDSLMRQAQTIDATLADTVGSSFREKSREYVRLFDTWSEVEPMIPVVQAKSAVVQDLRASDFNPIQWTKRNWSESATFAAATVVLYWILTVIIPERWENIGWAALGLLLGLFAALQTSDDRRRTAELAILRSRGWEGSDDDYSRQWAYLHIPMLAERAFGQEIGRSIKSADDFSSHAHALQRHFNVVRGEVDAMLTRAGGSSLFEDDSMRD